MKADRLGQYGRIALKTVCTVLFCFYVILIWHSAPGTSVAQGTITPLVGGIETCSGCTTCFGINCYYCVPAPNIPGCCNGTELGPDDICCGGAVYIASNGCCVSNSWYANGSSIGTCQVCSNAAVVPNPCPAGCGDTHTTNCIPGSITNVWLTVAPTNDVCVGNPITASVNYGTTNGWQIITSANHCGDTTNALGVTWVSNSWVVSGATITAGGGSSDTSVTFTGLCGNGSVSCTVYCTNTDSVCGFSASNSGSTNFKFHQTTITFDDTVTRGYPYWPCTWQAQLQAVCLASTNNTTTNFSTSYTSLASITYAFSVDTNGNVTSSKSGDGKEGDIGKIVVTSYQNINGYAGIRIEAHYIGCCDGGDMNWVQTVTATSAPPAGKTPPYADCFAGPPTQCPYYFGWPPGGSGWTSWDSMSSHSTTCP